MITTEKEFERAEPNEQKEVQAYL